jgi:hypothetical protein
LESELEEEKTEGWILGQYAKINETGQENNNPLD